MAIKRLLPGSVWQDYVNKKWVVIPNPINGDTQKPMMENRVFIRPFGDYKAAPIAVRFETWFDPMPMGRARFEFLSSTVENYRGPHQEA
jgi:hypothetical protein